MSRIENQLFRFSVFAHLLAKNDGCMEFLDKTSLSITNQNPGLLTSASFPCYIQQSLPTQEDGASMDHDQSIV